MANGPIDLDDRSSLVLCFDADLPESTTILNGNQATVVCDRASGITGTEPARRLTWDELRALPRGSLAARTVVVHTLRNVSLRKLSWGLRQCASDATGVLVDSHGSWFLCNGRGAVVRSVLRRGRRLLGSTPLAALCARYLHLDVDPAWPNLQATRAAAAEIVEFARGRAVRRPATPPTVVHYIGALGPGGAERQLALLAARTRARGHSVEVWTTAELQGSDAHYLPALLSADVRVRRISDQRGPLTPVERRTPGLLLLRDHLSTPPIRALTRELLLARPDALHCWLDGPNAHGGLAGVLAGVPRVVVSTRNMSPARLPRLLQPWYRATYAALARADSVRFLANSRAGADDYASWIGMDSSQIRVIYNGFEASGFPQPSPEQRRTQRAALDMPEDCFLVVGVFRLAEEKRPLDFLQVVARLVKREPRTRVLHLGVGELSQQVHKEAKRLGLSDALQFMGRVPSPGPYLLAADATVLVSECEGCPNAALESQALGVPIVATRAGGTAETLVDGKTGFLCNVGDVEAVADRLLELARDPSRRTGMGHAGQALIAERFGVERMVEESLRLYA